MVEIDTVYRAACMDCGETRSMADKRVIEDWADAHLAVCGKTSKEEISHNVFDQSPEQSKGDEFITSHHLYQQRAARLRARDPRLPYNGG